MCKRFNPKTFKSKIKQLCGKIFKSLALSYAYNTILFWFDAIQMKNIQFRFFSGKIVTSLADTFTMGTALFKIIFWHKIFIC